MLQFSYIFKISNFKSLRVYFFIVACHDHWKISSLWLHQNAMQANAEVTRRKAQSGRSITAQCLTLLTGIDSFIKPESWAGFSFERSQRSNMWHWNGPYGKTSAYLEVGLWDWLFHGFKILLGWIFWATLDGEGRGPQADSLYFQSLLFSFSVPSAQMIP